MDRLIFLRVRLVFSMAAVLFLVLFLAAPEVLGDELQEVVVKKYGYKFKIPKEFELQDKIDQTTAWIYQPGSTSEGKKKSSVARIAGAVRIKGVTVSGERAEASASESEGGLESALTIYVNWTWMPDVDSKTSYEANLKQIKQDIESPDPKYRDIQLFDKEKGYKWEGLAFWFKEVDKEDPTEIHRWHIKAFGNKSHYTVGLCGTYRQFQQWGPVYEQVIKSFELIPIEKQE